MNVPSMDVLCMVFMRLVAAALLLIGRLVILGRNVAEAFIQAAF